MQVLPKYSTPDDKASRSNKTPTYKLPSREGKPKVTSSASNVSSCAATKNK